MNSGVRFSSGTWTEAFRRGDFAVIADWFTFYFFGVGGICLVTVGLAAWADTLSYAAGLRIFALAVLFAGASTIGGWLLGLLFGVPRTLARPQPAGPGSATAGGESAAGAGTGARTNTNLEDISDWLTKTIVGVGLTQLYRAPGALWHAAAVMNANGFRWHPYGAVLALLLFLYFTPGGFWLGYVGTRTILTRLFVWAEGTDRALVATAGDPAKLQLDKLAATQPVADPALAEADRVLRSKAFTAMRTPDEQAAWGAAQARGGRYDAAILALQAAAIAQPRNFGFKEQLAKLYLATKHYIDASQVLRRAPPSVTAMNSALYDDPPGGYLKAIAVGQQLLDTGDGTADATLHVLLACAYGQEYAYEKSKDAANPDLDQIRQNAVAQVRAALQANPLVKSWLHSLWQPPLGSSDDDLATFPADDPGLASLLN